MAPGVAEKYYLADCSTTPSPGLTNGGSCNGSDVGLEDAIEDAANDPTLHSVSDSWGYGGDAEYGSADPFDVTATQQPRDRRGGRHHLLLLDGRHRHLRGRLPLRQPLRRVGRRHEPVLDAALVANISDTASATNGTSTLTFTTTQATALSTVGTTR